MFCNQKIGSHNPEVVGSSPASTTIKTQEFDKNSGVFSNFLTKNGASENAVGDSRGDSSQICHFKKPGILNFFPVFCFPDFLLFQGKTGHKINIAVGVSTTRIDGVFSFSTQQPVNGYIQDVCQGIQLNI